MRGCLAKELQTIMAPYEARDGPHNAKQLVTERLPILYHVYIIHRGGVPLKLRAKEKYVQQ